MVPGTRPMFISPENLTGRMCVSTVLATLHSSVRVDGEIPPASTRAVPETLQALFRINAGVIPHKTLFSPQPNRVPGFQPQEPGFFFGFPLFLSIRSIGGSEKDAMEVFINPRNPTTIREPLKALIRNDPQKSIGKREFCPGIFRIQLIVL